MGQPVRIMGKEANEAIQAQVDSEGNLHITLQGVDPIDGYSISDLDESGDPAYYGFVLKNGAYYIMEFSESSGTVRYTSGSSSYTVAWTNRATETYNYFYVEF